MLAFATGEVARITYDDFFDRLDAWSRDGRWLYFTSGSREIAGMTDVFTRRGYMTMTYRGQVAAPARSVLGQRALERPTILVTDQHSLSDAEDFTEGYRTLRLGLVVGEPTAGWIIYTSNAPLIDGSQLRIPFIQIRGGEGRVMETNPRSVDVRVDRPIGESCTDRDSQLDAAVRELLRQLDRR